MAGKNLPVVDWLEIKASAPGKFIISGEYSVVHDKPAIASAIDLRTVVTIRPNADPKTVKVNFKNLDSIREWSTSSLKEYKLVNKFTECIDYNDNMPTKLKHLLRARQPSQQATSQDKPGQPTQPRETDSQANDAAMAFLLLYISIGDSYYSSARPPLDVEVESNIPVGSGLGSSSALSVALCGALMRVFRVSAEKWIISNWAFEMDRFFHGQPSGIDNSVITHGGYINFQSRRIKFNGCVHNKKIKVMLIETGVSRSTRTVGEIVSRQIREDQSGVNEIFISISEITTQIWRRMYDPDFAPRSIYELIEANQNRLNSLGVGHPKLSDICERASAAQLSAKQTGAGGGGTAFVLYDDSNDYPTLDAFRQELIEAGYNVHDHDINCDGLIVNITWDPDNRFKFK